MKENKTNLFIVGAAKCGTTTLHSILSGHPDIFMSRVKEPHFFSDVFINTSEKVSIDKKKDYHSITVKDEITYHKLFEDGKKMRYRGEASPSYLWDIKTAERIYNYNQDAKVIIILRDPIKRCFSHYQMDITNGGQSNYSYFDALLKDYQLEKYKKIWGSKKSHLYVELGLYHSQITKYSAIFPKKQFLILTISDLKDINHLHLKLASFLSVNSKFKIREQPAANVAKLPKFKFIITFKNNLLVQSLNKVIGVEARQTIKALLYRDGYANVKMIKEGENYLKGIYKNEMELLYQNFGIDFRIP
jgi:hypothetical protein